MKKPPHELAALMLADVRRLVDRMQEEVELLLVPGFDDLIQEHVDTLGRLRDNVIASITKAHRFGVEVRPAAQPAAEPKRRGRTKR